MVTLADEERVINVWRSACQAASQAVAEADFELQGDLAIEQATELLALAHNLRGVACGACGGYGRRLVRVAENRLGIEACQLCRGTGRTDIAGEIRPAPLPEGGACTDL